MTYNESLAVTVKKFDISEIAYKELNSSEVLAAAEVRALAWMMFLRTEKNKTVYSLNSQGDGRIKPELFKPNI